MERGGGLLQFGTLQEFFHHHLHLYSRRRSIGINITGGTVSLAKESQLREGLIWEEKRQEDVKECPTHRLAENFQVLGDLQWEAPHYPPLERWETEVSSSSRGAVSPR
jgi:hypothetical protein